MVRLTVRLSEAEQFAVELPAATTTAAEATRTLARLHNLRLAIAKVREAAAAKATAAATEAGGEGGDNSIGNPLSTQTQDEHPRHLLLLLDAALDDLYEAAALRGTKAATPPSSSSSSSSSAPPPACLLAVAAKLAAARAAAEAAAGADAQQPPSTQRRNDAFWRALEAAEAEAREKEEVEDGQEEGGDTAAAAAADRLCPRSAACWFAGRLLQPPEATLARLLGGGCAVKADRTRAVVRLTRGGSQASGAPARGDDGGNSGGGGKAGGNGPDAETRNAMLAWCLKRQEQLRQLDEAARDGEDDHCDAPWADPRALRRELSGVGGGGVRWRC
jgi:hypothetical protein